MNVSRKGNLTFMSNETLHPIKPFDPLQNTGVIEQAPSLSAWIAGLESGIAYQEMNPGGEWDPWLPGGEQQFGVYFDSMNCTNYSGTNTLETQLNFLIARNLVYGEALKFLRDNGYFDNDGKVETSDRFAGHTSGTTPQGNTLERIWNAYRYFGLVPQKLWDFPYAQKNPVFDWDDYYAKPPQQLFALGKLFLKYFEIKWEWVAMFQTERTPLEAIEKHVKQAPLQGAHPTCPPWHTAAIIQPCGRTQSTHATMVHGLVKDSHVKDYDSYNPWQKKLALNYVIPWLVKGIIYQKPPQQPQPQPPAFRYHWSNVMLYGQRSEDIKALQQALKVEGLFPAAVQTTGYYGNITTTAVYKFQTRYKVASMEELNALQGRRVGTKTLAQLNKLFDKKTL